MSIDSENLAPYAPYNCVKQVITQLRSRGLPEQLTTQALARMGVAEGNISRTLQALRLLNLVDEQGYRTPMFDILGNAPDSEYTDVLGQVLKEAYGSVFKYVNPSVASDQDFINAFRPYQPKAQHDRMIRFFKAMCREANLMPGGAPEPLKRVRVANPTKPLNTPRTNGSRQPQVLPERPQQTEPVEAPIANDHQSLSSEHPLLEALLQQLPKGPNKRWTKARRDKWLQAVAANIDVLIEVEEETAMSK